MRALLQEAEVEVKDLDESTTEEELSYASTEQCNVEVPVATRIRKTFGGTQTPAIRLPVDAASRLAKTGKIKVERSLFSLRLTPRVTKHMERCFRWMEFGHQSRNCKDPEVQTVLEMRRKRTRCSRLNEATQHTVQAGDGGL